MTHRIPAILPRTLTAALLATALAACQPPAPPAAQTTATDVSAPEATANTRYNYQCGDLALGVMFDEGGENASLSFSGQRLLLPIAISASGARYADDAGNEFWTRGMAQASLTLAGQEARECSASQTASPWDLAADRGATFRAIGQEPGWMVEVEESNDGASLVAHLDYGEHVLRVSHLSIDENGDYHGSDDDGTAVTLRVEERECNDPMSGERFLAAATLSVGERSFAGCGARLDGD